MKLLIVVSTERLATSWDWLEPARSSTTMIWQPVRATYDSSVPEEENSGNGRCWCLRCTVQVQAQELQRDRVSLPFYNKCFILLLRAHKFNLARACWQHWIWYFLLLFSLVVMPPSGYQCQKVGILVSSQLLYFRYDNTSIPVSTGTMREGGRLLWKWPGKHWWSRQKDAMNWCILWA